MKARSRRYASTSASLDAADTTRYEDILMSEGKREVGDGKEGIHSVVDHSHSACSQYSHPPNANNDNVQSDHGDMLYPYGEQSQSAYYSQSGHPQNVYSQSGHSQSVYSQSGHVQLSAAHPAEMKPRTPPVVTVNMTPWVMSSVTPADPSLAVESLQGQGHGSGFDKSVLTSQPPKFINDAELGARDLSHYQDVKTNQWVEKHADFRPKSSSIGHSSKPQSKHDNVFTANYKAFVRKLPGMSGKSKHSTSNAEKPVQDRKCSTHSPNMRTKTRHPLSRPLSEPGGNNTDTEAREMCSLRMSPLASIASSESLDTIDTRVGPSEDRDVRHVQPDDRDTLALPRPYHPSHHPSILKKSPHSSVNSTDSVFGPNSKPGPNSNPKINPADSINAGPSPPVNINNNSRNTSMVVKPASVLPGDQVLGREPPQYTNEAFTDEEDILHTPCVQIVHS